MNILSQLLNIFKGGNDAQGTGDNLSRRSGHDRRIIHSIPAVCEQAVSDLGGIRMLAGACADERGRDTGAVSTDPVCQESRALIAAAKRVGCFVDATTVPGKRYTIRSGESEVRMVQKDQVYYKIKNPFAKLHLKKHPAHFVVFEHIVHNVLFPDCRLEFVGIAEDYSEARIVYRQKAVCTEARPDDGQIADDLAERGLLPDGRYSFGNPYVFVTDVGQDGDNVLLDDNGTLRFIDPIIGFREPLCSVLLTRDWSVEAVRGLVQHLYGITKEEQAFIESMIKPMA